MNILIVVAIVAVVAGGVLVFVRSSKKGSAGVKGVKRIFSRGSQSGGDTDNIEI